MRVKNWHQFQHYSRRNPPWIKLHRSLLDDFEFQCLPLASKALAPMLWLLASEQQGGEFDGSIERLSFRLRMTKDEVKSGLKPLLQAGFVADASVALALGLRDATPERETEGEREVKPTARKSKLPNSKRGDKT